MFMVDAYRLEVNYRQIACASALSSLRCRADKDFTEAAFMGSNISYSIGLIAIDQYYYFTFNITTIVEVFLAQLVGHHIFALSVSLLNHLELCRLIWLIRFSLDKTWS